MLTEFLKTYPEMVRTRVLRGIYYFEDKQFQAAIDDFRIAIEANPNDLALHQRIKTCYQYMGQRSAAAAEQDIIEVKLKNLPEEEQQKLRRLLEKLDAQTTSS